MAVVNEHLLRDYYAEHFLLESMTAWLSYGEEETSKQGVQLHLENDIYKRFLAFNTPKEFHQALKQDKPHKIDYG